ncbi:PAS domain S-box protein [Mariprofundus erugo]|nr:PAS domain S-box protein [Mariprofundus erugo]
MAIVSAGRRAPACLRSMQRLADHPAGGGMGTSGQPLQEQTLHQKRHRVSDHQSRYYRLLNAIHEVYYSTDMDGNITEISPSIRTVAGYDCHQIIGRPATFFYRHPEDRKIFLQLLHQHAFVSDYELELMHHDGRVIHVSANAHIMFDEQKRAVGVEGMLRDITERVTLQTELKRLNEELEARVSERTCELEEKNRQLQLLLMSIEQSAEAFIITDHAGRVEYVNPAFERINGYSPDEIRGKTLSILNSGEHDAGVFHHLWSTIRSGRVWEGTLINRKKSGQCYPALMTIVPVMERGEITHYTAIQQDMSKYEQLEAQFRQAQKLEAIGTLVGGISHDFNNMLASLLMNLYLARKEVRLPDKLTDRLNMTEKLVMQTSDMVRDLLIFSRDDNGIKEELELNEMVQSSLRLLQVSIPAEVKFSFMPSREKLPVRGDVRRLQQVLMNVLNNARDALAGRSKGELSLALQRYIPDQEFLDRHHCIHAEVLAHLSIRDNGAGMPPEVMERVFDPFFTTKSAGNGTGLGLSMVFGYIEEHGGVIEVESEVDKGTVFHFFLPVMDQSEKVLSVCDEVVLKGNGELILVVDDNENFRHALTEALAVLNYRTMTAADGVEALLILEAHHHDLSLAIIDMVMPRLSGSEAARRMRLLSPWMPILFATGHGDAEVIREVDSLNHVMLCEKPFRLDRLSQHIHALIHGGQAVD